jgi:hypothetical protein
LSLEKERITRRQAVPSSNLHKEPFADGVFENLGVDLLILLKLTVEALAQELGGGQAAFSSRQKHLAFEVGARDAFFAHQPFLFYSFQHTESFISKPASDGTNKRYPDQGPPHYKNNKLFLFGFCFGFFLIFSDGRYRSHAIHIVGRFSIDQLSVMIRAVGCLLLDYENDSNRHQHPHDRYSDRNAHNDTNAQPFPSTSYTCGASLTAIPYPLICTCTADQSRLNNAGAPVQTTIRKTHRHTAIRTRPAFGTLTDRRRPSLANSIVRASV